MSELLFDSPLKEAQKGWWPGELMLARFFFGFGRRAGIEVEIGRARQVASETRQVRVR